MSCGWSITRVNRGYGAALRSGFGAARYPLVCFTDGDRQFRIADLRLLLERMDSARGRPGRPRAAPDVVVGYRIKRADPAIRLAYARTYRACLRLFFGLRRPGRRLRLQAVPTRGAGGHPARIGRRVPVARSCSSSCARRSATVVEVGVPHHRAHGGARLGRRPAGGAARGA